MISYSTDSLKSLSQRERPSAFFILQIFIFLFALRFFTTIVSVVIYSIYLICFSVCAILGVATLFSIFDVCFYSRKSPISTLDSFKRPSFLDNRSLERQKERGPYRRKPFLQSAAIQKSVDEILGYISRDFIQSWYPYISSEQVFVNAFDKLLRHIIKSFCERLNMVSFARHSRLTQENSCSTRPAPPSWPTCKIIERHAKLNSRLSANFVETNCKELLQIHLSLTRNSPDATETDNYIKQFPRIRLQH